MGGKVLPAGPPMGAAVHTISPPTVSPGSQPHWQFRSSPAGQVPMEGAAEESRMAWVLPSSAPPSISHTPGLEKDVGSEECHL